MDRLDRPLKGKRVVAVVLDRGIDRRPEAIHCRIIRHWLDDQLNQKAIVETPAGKELQVVFSEISRTWRLVR